MVPRGVAVPVPVGVPRRKVKAILKGYMSLSMERAGECGAGHVAGCCGSVGSGWELLVDVLAGSGWGWARAEAVGGKPVCSGSVPWGCYPALQVISVASVY